MKNIFEIIKRKVNKKKLVNPRNLKESGRIYEALTPTEDIEHGEEYLAALGWALSQPSIHNIAISGPYGSGKSSTIKAYLKKYESDEVVNISLATFDLKEVERQHNSDNGQSGKPVEEDKLEATILKQLFYAVDGRRIPQSRYRKLQAGNNLKSIWVAIALAIILPAVLYFSFPNNAEAFVEMINAFGDYKTIVAYAVLILAFLYVIACVVGWFRRSGSIKEIKILDKATLGSTASNEESIFNKNMDEIVYFFESTKKRIVIIEDLDRFENSSIFVALRELNSVINNNEKINGSVKFVYAIKDDMFKKPGERTKFFDFIIPIIPYISSTNSGEILRARMNVPSYEISDKYISLVSPYISDMRDLMSICNEFNVYKNTLKGKQQLNLIDENMLSLVIYKNLYPNDFAKLEEESSACLIRKAFKNKKDKISEQEKLKEDNKRIAKEELAKIEGEVYKNVKELKVALINSLMGFDAGVYMIYIEGKQYPLKSILRDDFDIELLKKSLTVYWAKININTNTSISNPEEVVKNNGDYFTRIERVQKGLEKCKNDSRHEIEEYEKKINEMKSYSIKQVITEFGTGFLDDDVKENDLLVFFLRNGFIDENFENYINYFHPNSITKEDMNYVLGVRNHRSVGGYEYEISNPEKVYTMLQDYEFKQVEIFNFDMVDHILENNKQLAITQLFDKLKDQSPESIDFVKAYVDREKHLDMFFKYICEKNKCFWDSMVSDGAITKEKQYLYLVNMLKYVDVETIVAMDDSKYGDEDDIENSITGLLIGEVDALEKICDAPAEKVAALIEQLDVEFYDTEIQGIDEQILDVIIDCWLYALNEKMLYRLCQIKKPELVDKMYTQSYTSILEWNCEPILAYVRDKRFFSGYVKNVVLGLKDNIHESLEAVEDILKRLAENNIDLCMHLIEKECTVWDDLSFCLSNQESNTEIKGVLWKKILDCDKAKAVWDNYVKFYNAYGIENELGTFFKRHLREFLADKNNAVITDEIKTSLIFLDLSSSELRRCIRAFNVENYNESILDLKKEKIEVLIEENVLAFNSTLWDEMETVAPELRVTYAKSNKKEFLKDIDQIELVLSEINEILVDNDFSETDKKAVLRKIEPDSLEIETAMILKDVSFLIGHPLADAAWSILENDKRYALLLNQISIFSDDELADKFGELDEVYHVLSGRTKHKFKLADNEYNNKLLTALARRGYITSFQPDMDNKENVLVGYVKQRKGGTIAAN